MAQGRRGNAFTTGRSQLQVTWRHLTSPAYPRFRPNMTRNSPRCQGGMSRARSAAGLKHIRRRTATEEEEPLAFLPGPIATIVSRMFDVVPLTVARLRQPSVRTGYEERETSLGIYPTNAVHEDLGKAPTTRQSRGSLHLGGPDKAWTRQSFRKVRWRLTGDRGNDDRPGERQVRPPPPPARAMGWSWIAC